MTYSKGAASVYFEWIRLQGPQVEALGRRFRPWEQYGIEGTDNLVSVTSFNDDDTINVLVDYGPDTGELQTVDPDRLVLWSIPALDNASK